MAIIEDELEALLVKNLMVNPETGEGVNDTLDVLNDSAHELIEALRFSDAKARKLLGEEVDEPKSSVKGVFDGDGEIRPNFQLLVCKWSEVKEKSVKPVVYDPNGGKRSGSAGTLAKVMKDEEGKRVYEDNKLVFALKEPSDSLTVLPENGQKRIADKVGAYFYELFCTDNAPLKSMGETLTLIEENFKSYVATLSVDLYYSRSPTQNVLHKDTTGNTLFVGLHYLNEKDILGPEWIVDLKPMKQRRNAPWGKANAANKKSDKKRWPELLLRALEQARESIAKTHTTESQVMQVKKLPPNALVAFVDELIWHTTPKADRRDPNGDNPFDRLSSDQVFSIEDATGHDKLLRRFSLDAEELKKAIKGTAENEPRAFIRFWAMVEPKDYIAE